MFAQGLLKENQFNQIDDLGFVWKEKPPTPPETLPQRKELQGIYSTVFDFLELKQFVEKNGHCIVSKEDKKLSQWLGNLRTYQRMGRLNPKLERTLENCGVVFDFVSLKMFGKSWDDMCERLKEYYRTHGSFSISKKEFYVYPLIALGLKTTSYIFGLIP